MKHVIVLVIEFLFILFILPFIIMKNHILGSAKYTFCLSLIIPSTLEDLIRCYNILIRSVCKSITYPDEIILVISGIYSQNVSKVVSFLKILNNCTNNLIIIYRKNKHNAASNRNLGYFKSHCSIISYFDIDDIMSIYRINIIRRIFNQNRNIDVVFHPSTRNYSMLDIKNISQLYSKYIKINQYNVITKRCRDTFFFDNRIYKCDVSNGFYITNGWPSLKRNIMKFILFNESLTSTEDLDFISRVVAKGYKVALFTKALGFYIKDNICNI